MSTKPAAAEPESVTRIKSPSPFVLALMTNGFSAAEAIEIARARAAESTRLAQLAASF